MNVIRYSHVSSQDGLSSLMVASLNGHVEVVDKLLQHGATVDLQKEVLTTIYACICVVLPEKTKSTKVQTLGELRMRGTSNCN